MILKFNRIDSEIVIDAASITTVEINDRPEFSRMATSLMHEKGLEGAEPYELVNDAGKSLKPKKAFILCASLPDLPFTDRALTTALYAKIAREVYDQPELDDRVKALALNLREELAEVQHEMFGSYSYASNWESEAFLKAFAFGADASEDDSFLERCKAFIGLCADAVPNLPICFINLKSFLSEKDLGELFEFIFSLGEQVLLMESWHDVATHERERKIVVDQQFLEN